MNTKEPITSKKLILAQAAQAPLATPAIDKPSVQPANKPTRKKIKTKHTEVNEAAVDDAATSAQSSEPTTASKQASASSSGSAETTTGESAKSTSSTSTTESTNPNTETYHSAQADSTSNPAHQSEQSAAGAIEPAEGMSTAQQVALGAAGLIGTGGGAAALAGAGGAAAAASAATAATVVASVATGVVVAGPVVAGNDLTIALYKADGITLIGTANVDSQGRFSIDLNGYQGVIVAKVVSNGTNPDYVDEAQGIAVNLGADLGAIGIADATGVTLYVNPLTAIAAKLAGLDLSNLGNVSAWANGAPTANDVNAANTAVANAFGISGSLTNPTAITTVVDAQGNVVSTTDAYGQVLAVLSQLDLQNSSMQQTIDDIAADLQPDLALDAPTQVGLVAAATVVQATLNTLAQTQNSSVVFTGLNTNIAVQVQYADTTAPTAATNPATATAGPIISPSEAAAGVAVVATLAGTGAVAGDTIELMLGGASFSTPLTHVLTAAEITAGSYTFTVAGSALGPDGSKSLTSVITDIVGNVGAPSPALVLSLDTTAPVISSSNTAPAISENSGSGQTVYTAVATDAGIVNYSLKNVGDYGSFNINSSTGAVSLIGNPDYETKSSYTFTVVATDGAGNTSEQAVTFGIGDLDEISPTVSSVGITGATISSGSVLNTGDTVTATVIFSENVVVAGAPYLVLNMSSNTARASYVSGSGTQSLQFSYVIQGGDNDSNGISIAQNGLVLNGGSILDAAGNTAVLNHNATGYSQYTVATVDTTAPTVSNVAITGQTGALNGFLNAGDTVSVSVTLSEAVTVTGSPTIDLVIGSTTVQATYVSGSNSNTLVFSYTILSGQADNDGIAISGNTLALNNGTINDLAGNSLVLTHNGATANVSYKVDTAAPVAQTISFSGLTDYGTQNGLSPITSDNAFDIVISAGEVGVTHQFQVSSDGNTWSNLGSASPSTLNSVMLSTDGLYYYRDHMVDSAGNVADSNVIHMTYDHAGPQVQSVAITPKAGNAAFVTGDTMEIVVTYNENVNVNLGNQSASVGLNLDIGGQSHRATYTSGSGTNQLTFSYTIGQADSDSDGISINQQSLTQYNGASTYDDAGNAAGGVTNLSALTNAANSLVNPPQPFTGDTSVVIFDLVHGVSSDHSGRIFNANTAYTIYIVVDDSTNMMNTTPTGAAAGATWGEWDAANLGSDDQIIFMTLSGNAPLLFHGTANLVHNTLGNPLVDTVTMATTTIRLGYHYTTTQGYSGTRGAFKLTSQGRLSTYDTSTSRSVDLWNSAWSVMPVAGMMTTTNNTKPDFAKVLNPITANAFAAKMASQLII